MRKIYKMKFLKMELNRNKLVSAWNMKKKQQKHKHQMKMTVMSEGLQLY